MAKTTVSITDNQSGTTQFPNGEIIPRPVLNNSPTPGIWSASGRNPPTAQSKKKFVLLDQDGKIVATLIDRVLAEKWVSDHKRGAARFIEDILSSSPAL
jgi:hypothetical protein